MTLSEINFSRKGGFWSGRKISESSAFEPNIAIDSELQFHAKPLSHIAEEVDSVDEDNESEEGHSVEDISPVESLAELESLEPDEPRVSFTESEYESHISEKLVAAEIRVKEQLDIEFKAEISRLKSRQSEFFEAVFKALRSETLTSEIVSFAMKIASFLARSELKINESVIADFVNATLEGFSRSDGQDVTVQLSREWESYLAVFDENQNSNVSFLFEDSLHSGDVIVTAGNSGRIDLLDERIESIEDQLQAAPQPLEFENYVELLRSSLRGYTVEEETSAGSEISPDFGKKIDDIRPGELSGSQEEIASGSDKLGSSIDISRKEEDSDG